MSQGTTSLPDTRGIREVRDEEVAAFHDNGWVKLEGLVPEDMVVALLERAQARMGDDAADAPMRRAEKYEAWLSPAVEDEWVAAFSYCRELAAVTSRMVRDRPVRFYSDLFMAKLPVSRSGSDTPWHQDLPFHPLDRAGCTLLWVPLVDCPPEKGSLRFLSGSHRAGPLGRFYDDSGPDIVDYYPELLEEYEKSPPLHLKVGDATLHSISVIHSAPPNGTDSPRWVHTSARMNADTLYTGVPLERTDGLGLEVGKPFDHPNFPLLVR